MKPRKLLFLAFVVVALGLFIYLFESDIPSTDESKERAEKVLLVEAEEVTSLTWAWNDKRVELVRETRSQVEDGGSAFWLLRAPYRARADEVAVNALLAALLNWKKEGRLEGADREEIGLVLPRAELRLETSRGPEVVRFGAALPLGQTMVVEVEGSDPVVVSDAIWGDLTKAPGSWRNLEILHFTRDAIGHIRLESPSASLRLALRGESYWLEEPVVDLASQELVRSLIGSLVGLRAQSFVDDEAEVENAGFEPPAATLEIGLEDREEVLTVELGVEVEDSPGQIYARRGEQIFIVRGDLLEAARRPVEGWRSRSVTTLDRWQIESIEIVDGEDQLLVERSGVDWQRNGVMIEQAAVDELLVWLSETYAEGLVDEDEPSTRAAVICTLLDRTGRRETLSFYETDDGDRARNSRRTSTLILGADTISELGWKIAALRSAEPEGGEEGPEAP